MAKLKIAAPDGKFLLVDVGDADKDQYDELATAAVNDYMSKGKPAAPPSVAQQNLDALDGKGPIDDLKTLFSDTGKDVKAGYAGIADLIAGNGLSKSVANINNVEDDKEPTTQASYLGRAFGSQFTPAQIALQAFFGKIGEAVAPWIENAMKGWAADVAVNAVGKIKKVADALGVKNLDALGKFLMQPIQIGGKTFEPIVTATSSPEDMLAATNTALQAAGKELEAVAANVNGAIKGITDESGMTMNVADKILDIGTLTKNVQTLKEEAVGDLPNLGKAVAKQYDDALKDLSNFVEKQAEGDSTTMFSDLAHIKTKIGNLVYKHGSPLESKAALNDVYHAISDALDTAAKNVGGEHSAAYQSANAIYHQLMAVAEALEGKVVDAKKLFDAPAFLAAMSAGLATHGPLAAVTVPTAYVGMKMAEKYGPQVIAQGLEKGAPLVAGTLKVTSRGIPVVGNAIYQGLQSDDNQ